MKNLLLLLLSFIFINNIFSQNSFCDDFEIYQSGDYIAQNSSDWETWASIMAPCPTTPCADDAMISSALSSSGSNSLYLTAGGGPGGPQDILLPFGTGIPHTTGNFELTTNLYVNTSAYLNIQADTVVGQNIGVWALNINIDATGIIIDGGSTPTVFLTSTFPLNQWVEFKLNINLDLNIWEVFIDNQSIGSFSNPTNKVSSINLYPTVGNDYYVDDICFTHIPFTPLAYDMAATDLTTPLNVALSASPFTISGDITNLSSTPINTVDINYSINGGPTVTDNLTGLNLNIFDVLSFNHAINWVPPSTGIYEVKIWASNLNGNTDLDPSNDIFTDTIYVWNNIAVRIPLIETFTSSTCGPCAPANTTAEALFAQNIGAFTSIKYQADFPGVGDPYFTLEGGNRMDYYMPPGFVSVPRMQIDGGWNQNGGLISQQVLDEYISVLTFVNLSATYSINIKTIEVDITIDPFENIQSNNLVVHTAIIEETTYNNIQNNGETQFEHVVKKMIPDDNGTAISSLTAGQQNTLNLNYTFNGSYRLPVNATQPINHAIEHSVEDFTNLMVVVWVQDVVTKEVYQSVYATIESIISIEEDINEQKRIFPNPATDNIFISNLKENTIIKILDINGRLVLETEYKGGKQINVSSLSPGVYQIQLQGVDFIETRKLIKE